MKQFKLLSFFICLSIVCNLMIMPESIAVQAAEPEYGVNFNIAIKQLVSPSATRSTTDTTITAIEWTNEDLSTDGTCINSGVSAPIYAKLDDTTVKLYSAAPIISLSGDWSRMFYHLTKCCTIDLSRFDTSNVTNMSGMFNSCQSLANLNFSRFNTSNVTDMSYMFAGCNSLADLNVRYFNTSQVENMSNMFYNCRSITNLDLSSFDTANVQDMNNMFAYCALLTNLNVSNFNTLKVTDMQDMFYLCVSLQYLDVSSFDISNTTNMQDMFRYCTSLIYLKAPVIPNLPTSYIPTLPSLDTYTWHLDDDVDTAEIIVGDGLVHTYKRDDYIDPQLSNPTDTSIELTATQDISYTISAPALVEFKQDFDGYEYRAYDTDTWSCIDNYGTYYAECNIETHGSWIPDRASALDESRIKISATVPTMTGAGHNVDLQMLKSDAIDDTIITQLFPTVNNDQAYIITYMYLSIITENYAEMPEPNAGEFCNHPYNSDAELEYLRDCYTKAQQLHDEYDSQPLFQKFYQTMTQNNFGTILTYAYLIKTSNEETAEAYMNNAAHICPCAIQNAAISGQNVILPRPTMFYKFLDEPAYEQTEILLRGQFDHQGTYSGNLTINFSLTD